VRYLTLAEALIIAEAVTGIDAVVLARASRVELLDSALHAPQAGFGDEEFYPEFVDKDGSCRSHRAEPSSPGWEQAAGVARASAPGHERHLRRDEA
jgi:death-on-curing protein